MTTSTQPRPRQVTMAAWMIMLGSVFVVLTVVEMVSGLRSLETREAVEGFLSEPPGEGMGLSVESTLTLMRTVAMVAAGCATAAAVLGGYVLKRNRQARVALTVLAAPLFVSGLVTGGFMSALVVAASVMLWLSPAREWFDGRPLPQPPTRRDAPPHVHRDAPPHAHRDAHRDAPFGAHRDGTTGPAEGGPRPAERPFGTPPLTVSVPGARHVAVPSRRPDAVVAAAILTWVAAGLALLSSLTAVVLMASSPETILAELDRTAPELAEQGVSDRMVEVTTYVSGGITIVWCVLAIVLAALMLGRRRWAARGLILLATVSAMLSFAALIGSLLMVVPAVASVLTVLCLRQAAAVAWFAGAPR